MRLKKERLFKKSLKLEAKALEEAEAALAEKARLEEEARLIEEAEQLARESAERLRAPPESNEDRYKDLVTWISNVPVTKPESDRTDRAFSDGVLIAEIVEYYAPHLCNRKEFFRAYSTCNKLINWNHLNTKVFSELGFRLKEKTIRTIINPISYISNNMADHPLFKLLFKLQAALGAINTSLYDYRRKKDGEPGVPFKLRKPTTAYPNGRPRSGQPTYSKIELQIAKLGTEYFISDPDSCTTTFQQPDFQSCCCLQKIRSSYGYPTPPPSRMSYPIENDHKVLNMGAFRRTTTSPRCFEYQRDPELNCHSCINL